MRFETIQLINYRQHQNTIIEFDHTKEHDLHILIGKNGAGKTNLLSAINWCLYGEEGQLSEKSEAYPLVNVISCEETTDSSIFARVIITMTATNHERIEVIRTQHFYFTSNHKPEQDSQDFVVIVSVGDGNDRTLTGDLAIQKLKSIVPQKIKEFFFFDGERLDTYFQAQTAANIKKAVYDISQIDILPKLKERLETTKVSLRQNIKVQDPLIENKEREIETHETIIKTLEIGIENCQEQIEISDNEIEKLDSQLRNIPDIAHIEQERINADQRKRNSEKKRDQLVSNKNSLLIEWGRLLFSYNSLKKGIDYIEQKRKQKELPPQVDIQLIKETLEHDCCLVCGRVLENESIEYVKNISKEISITSEIGRQLMDLENLWYRLIDRIDRINNDNVDLTQQIAELERTIADCEKQINEIDIDLSQYSLQEVRLLQKQRKEYETISREQTERLGVKKRDLGIAKAKLEQLNNSLKDLEHKKTKNEERRKIIDICDKALDIVTKSHVQIMEDIRRNVEKRTQEYFFDLIWKKATFHEVTIDQKFKLHLVDSLGYECLGSISAAERELLALSFTLAMHLVSGFDAPLVIDTPLSRVSDDNRRNFANVLSEISKNKQIILLFTPDEYTNDVKQTLQHIRSSFNEFEVQSSERITKVVGYNVR